MDKEIVQKIIDIGEQLFKTAQDPTQIPISWGSYYKLQELHQDSLLCKTENGELISYVVTLPTKKELMNDFLEGKINERELLDLTKPQKIYEALYLCEAFTTSEHRRRGYIIELFRQAISSIPHTSDVKLFTWPFSEEFKKLTEKLSSILGTKILIKE